MFDLTEKVAVVTGSSRGIGAAVAGVLATRGAKVVVNYRSSGQEAENVVAAIKGAGGEAIAIQADVSQSDAASQLINPEEINITHYPRSADAHAAATRKTRLTSVAATTNHVGLYTNLTAASKHDGT